MMRHPLRITLRAAALAVVGIVGLLLAAAAPALQTASPSAAATERIKRDVARCKKTQNLETCDDAVRWVPSDPVLLVAFGDALMRTQHPADALRQYQRAAALAPRMPGVGAKISSAEAHLPKRVPAHLAQAPAAAPAHVSSAAAKPAKPPVARNAVSASGSSFTNDAADTHTH